MNIETKFLLKADKDLIEVYKHLKLALPKKESFEERIRMSPGSPETEHTKNLTERVSIFSRELRKDVRTLVEAGWGRLPIVERYYRK